MIDSKPSYQNKHPLLLCVVMTKSLIFSLALKMNTSAFFLEHPKWPFSTSTNYDDNHTNPRYGHGPDVEFPACNIEQSTSRRQPHPTVGTSPVPKLDGSNCGHSENRSQMIHKSTEFATTRIVTQSIDMSRIKMPGNNSQQPWQTARSATTTNNSIYKKYFGGDDDDGDEEGNASKESKPMTDRRSTLAQNAGQPKFLKKTLKTADNLKPDDQSIQDLPNKTDKSDTNQQSSSSIQTYSSSSAIIDKTEQKNHSTDTVMDPQRCRDLIVFVQSLQVRYELHIPVNSTIRQLKNTIWQKINVNVERCQEQSHTLLLFTHRMHIFLSEEAELVSEFMKLTPSEPHFYFYALRRPQQRDEMYTYETKTSNLFSINTDWWTPVHFMEDAQLPRPQSVLLSSLYALRLFFYK
jgi:hypothetical protein